MAPEQTQAFAVVSAGLRLKEHIMRYAPISLIAAAVSLTFVATPSVAQTFNGFNNNDPAVTRSYAPFQSQGGGYSNGWNNGVPVIGPVFGMFTGTGQPGCRLDRDFNGRYTSVCGS